MKKITRLLINHLRRTDKLLLLLCLACSCFSVVLLYAEIQAGLIYTSNPMRTINVQILSIVLGIIAALVLAGIDYRFMARLWKLHVPVSYLLMVFTFFYGVGTVERTEDRAWLQLPFGLSFQPSELLKISFILVFALHLEKVGAGINHPKNLIPLCLHGAVPVLLLHFQGDDGTGIVFAVIFMFMLFAAGLYYRYIAGAGVLAGALLPVIWIYVLNEDQRQRILIFLNPELDPLGMGYQQIRSERSIGSGQLWGAGLFNVDHPYVPEIQNDYMFAFIGRALGFIGCLAVITMLIVICVRILMTALRAVDPLGRYICVGIFAMLATHTLVNIGMNVGMLPVIGIPLPFFSSGGSATIILYASIGVAMSVYDNRRGSSLFDEK